MWRLRRVPTACPSVRNWRVRYHPVKGNKEGSLMTMMSLDGLIFGIINIIGNFGTVFVDQAYWQGAIAAKPSATYKGYLLGGLVWWAAHTRQDQHPQKAVPCTLQAAAPRTPMADVAGPPSLPRTPQGLPSPSPFRPPWAWARAP